MIAALPNAREGPRVSVGQAVASHTASQYRSGRWFAVSRGTWGTLGTYSGKHADAVPAELISMVGKMTPCRFMRSVRE
jgi:hypothetical protein